MNLGARWPKTLPVRRYHNHRQCRPRLRHANLCAALVGQGKKTLPVARL
ncbi:hypothetical protein [Gallaecimonas sp. GXIMD1310]